MRGQFAIALARSNTAAVIVKADDDASVTSVAARPSACLASTCGARLKRRKIDIGVSVECLAGFGHGILQPASAIEQDDPVAGADAAILESCFVGHICGSAFGAKKYALTTCDLASRRDYVFVIDCDRETTTLV